MESAILPLFIDTEVSLSAFDNRIDFQDCWKLILMTWGYFLPTFSSRTNLKLHNIPVTPSLDKKVITNLDSSKVSGPDSIAVLVLKNCQSKLSYLLAKIFNMFLKESWGMLGRGLKTIVLLLMTFLMMLFLILLSLLMILLSSQIVIRHLICGTNYNWLLNLIWLKRHWTGAGSGLLILMLEKLNLFCLTGLITLELLLWKWLGLFSKENHLFWFWHWFFVLN